jgi:hypothetical protein
MKRGIPDPSWKNGPADPKHDHSEHALAEPVYDVDGVGRDEAEKVDGAFICVIEHNSCRREFCEASRHKRHVYQLDHELREDLGSVVDNPVEYASEHATIVDYDEKPVVGITIGTGEQDPLGYMYPAETFDASEGGTRCHGEPLEPSPEPGGL